MKRIVLFMCGVSVCIGLVGCNNAKEDITEPNEAVYEYVKEISADAQFESILGLATEQPVFDDNNNKIGKRLYVESSKDKVNEETLNKFYEEISNNILSYEDIVISLDDNNAVIQVLVNEGEVWYCTMNDNMELVKEKKLY